MVPGQTISCAMRVRYMNMPFIMKNSPGSRSAIHTVPCKHTVHPKKYKTQNSIWSILVLVDNKTRYCRLAKDYG